MFEGRNVHYTSSNKPLCSYSGKVCNLRRLKDYAFCVRHILEDPSAPYKQCAYVVKASKMRCTSAIPDSEERLYCNSHMQCMGMIPKKERRKKLVEYLPEGRGIPSLDNFKLPNGHIQDENRSNQPNFSASKMFPELAGKLSTLDSRSLSAAKTDCPQKSITKTSPRANNSGSGTASSRRLRRTPRKAVSIQRKKQLGLMTDEEAKAEFSANGCKTYAQYVTMRSDDAEVLAPLIESSDDESSSRLGKLIISSNRCLRESSSIYSSPFLFSSAKLDLNNGISDTEPEQCSLSECDEESDNTNELLRFKKSCLQLSEATALNCDLVKYKTDFTKSLIETIKDNLSSAVLLVRKIRRVKPRSKHKTGDSEVSRTNLSESFCDNQNRCLYQGDDGDNTSCGASTLPLSAYCMKHISHSLNQQLFTQCSFGVGENGETALQICENPAIDLGYGINLCRKHAPRAVDPYDTEQELNLRRRKKKSKPFSCRRSKKRRKTTKVPNGNDSHKAACPSSSSDSGLALNGGRSSAQLSSPGTSKPLSSSPVHSSSPRLEDDEGLDSDTEIMLSPLADSLLHGDSKILNDNEIDEVLNEENFNILSTVSDDKHAVEAADLVLGEADADLIFNGADEMLDNLHKDELPDDITDAILHVEYLEQQEKRKQEQQNKHHTLQHQHSMPLPQSSHNLLSPSSGGFVDLNGASLVDSFSDSDFHQLSQSFNSHQGPPPDYPGATKLLSPVTSLQQQLSHPGPGGQGHMNNYIHEQTNNSRFTHHHALHSKIPAAMSPSAGSQHHMLRQASYPVTLPPSSTLLNNSAAAQFSSNRSRLPPVSSIALQPVWPNSDTPTAYQNGYHTDHSSMYQQLGAGGLPSPPQYPSASDLMYPGQMFSPGGYGNPGMPQPKRVNLHLQ